MAKVSSSLTTTTILGRDGKIPSGLAFSITSSTTTTTTTSLTTITRTTTSSTTSTILGWGCKIPEREGLQKLNPKHLPSQLVSSLTRVSSVESSKRGDLQKPSPEHLPGQAPILFWRKLCHCGYHYGLSNENLEHQKLLKIL